MRMDSIHVTGVLSEEECDQLILELSADVFPSLTTNGKDKFLSDYRGSEQRRLSRTRYAELYNRIENVIMQINEKLFSFDVTAIEDMQFTKYTPDNGGYFKRHHDYIKSDPFRKITAVIQLSSADDYEGGDLKVQLREEAVVPKIKGSMVAFPSFTFHEVTPVTSGTRYTLVIWGTGPEFK